MVKKRISLRARIMRKLSSRYFDRIDTETANPIELRHRLDDLLRHLPLSRGVTSSTSLIGGVHSMTLTPKDASSDSVLFYLHGGAYVMGSPISHRNFVSRLAREAGIKAVLPDYRMAPEHQFPVAVDDAVSVYRALLNSGQNANRIVIAGDSAGGGLSMACMLSLRDRGLPLPAGAFLLSPWTDLAATGESMESNRGRDPWFSKEDVAHVAHYYAGETSVTDPLVSPVYADMHNLPPVFIQVGDLEVLLSDSTRLAQNIREAGGAVDIEIWEEMWHVFQVFYLVMPESRAAIRNMAARMRQVLSKA
jgi:acetyl esterase/lipase